MLATMGEKPMTPEHIIAMEYIRTTFMKLETMTNAQRDVVISEVKAEANDCYCEDGRAFFNFLAEAIACISDDPNGIIRIGRKAMNFNYEAEIVSNLTRENLINWVTELFTYLCDTGIITDIDTEIQQQLAIIAKAK